MQVHVDQTHIWWTANHSNSKSVQKKKGENSSSSCFFLSFVSFFFYFLLIIMKTRTVQLSYTKLFFWTCFHFLIRILRRVADFYVFIFGGREFQIDDPENEKKKKKKTCTGECESVVRHSCFYFLLIMSTRFVKNETDRQTDRQRLSKTISWQTDLIRIILVACSLYVSIQFFINIPPLPVHLTFDHNH